MEVPDPRLVQLLASTSRIIFEPCGMYPICTIPDAITTLRYDQMDGVYLFQNVDDHDEFLCVRGRRLENDLIYEQPPQHSFGWFGIFNSIGITSDGLQALNALDHVLVLGRHKLGYIVSQSCGY